ncbi:hypothetical protein [Halorussus halobius]|uniref:hypothetical protein n=1 Tax=Halorussus halobius TaxID=1710537 RepID=UPI001091E691|nr:hypothetical protein [Halorussus halobius]
MAIIELNLEKPALKRVESGEKPSRTTTTESTSGNRDTTESSESTVDVGTPAAESGPASTTGQEPDRQSDSGGKSRLRKYGRRMAILGGTAAGVAAARKLRQRRKAGSDQQDLDDDWQTADPTSSSESSSR